MAAERDRLKPESFPDDFLHDLVGAGPDADEAGVAPGALDRVVGHVAGATPDLHGRVRDLVRHLARDQLGHGYLLDGVLSVPEAPRHRIVVFAGELDPGRQLA